jgi:predicted AlkP superfamily phosphohydrolase/phosphomutase
MMSADHTVFYLALDACDAGIATRLAAEGRMPTLQRLLGEAAHIRTEAPAGVFVSANWPTLVTGLDPAHHGYFCWKQFVPGTYVDVPTTPDLVSGTPLWERLSDAGRRVAIVDVPHTRAPAQLNGLMLVEWGCHDRHFGTHSFPASLVDELNERFGPHPVGTRPQPHPGWDQFAPCDYMLRDGHHRTPDEQEAIWETLLDAQERKRRASLHLLGRGPWDLFMSVLGESHCTGHQLWSVHDPSHPWHDPDVRARMGDPIVEMYGRLDAAVADHLERIPPEATVYVHLSHGMGPHYDGTHLLDDVLRRLAAAERGGPRQRARDAASAAMGSVARVGGGRAAALLRDRLRSGGPPPDLGPDPDPMGDDRATRPWFSIPNNTVSGAIRLNVIGREPRGIIAPGADAHAACERLARWLGELVNADSGEPVVAEVVRTDRVYERRPGDALPDLLVEWNRNRPIERVWSPRIGLVERAATHWRTGDHTTGGLLLARGPGIVPGDKGTAKVVHVGATLAAATGVLLDDVDGRPLTDLLPTPVRSPEPVARPVADAGGASGAPAFTQAGGAAARRVWVTVRSANRLARRTVDDRVRAHAGVLAGRLDQLGDAHHITRAIADEAAARATQATETARDLAAVTEQRLVRLEREAAIRTVTAWIEAAEVASGPLISIVLPTRDRAALLPRALASVEAQVYGTWELIVVDDGSTDGTKALLGTVTDPRIRVLRSPGLGCAAARNLALDAARGDVIAYLDDDNTFDRLWCKALAWAFGQRPDVDVLYGARLIDDIDRVRRVGSGAMPTIQFEPFDRAALERGNIADMGVIAHRAGLSHGRFDPSLDAHADWDLLLRLTEDALPLELPVIACHYTSDAPGRLSDGDISDLDRVRARLAAEADASAPSPATF